MASKAVDEPNRAAVCLFGLFRRVLEFGGADICTNRRIDPAGQSLPRRRTAPGRTSVDYPRRDVAELAERLPSRPEADLAVSHAIGKGKTLGTDCGRRWRYGGIDHL